MAKKDANDLAAEGGPEALRRATEQATIHARKAQAAELGLRTVEELEAQYNRKYRPAVIYGLLREGEILNIVAPPKIGKSWLTYYIALSIAAGCPIFRDEWQTSPGPVVLIDNELHDESIGARIPALVDAMNIHPSIKRAVHVIPLRGRLKTMGLKDDDDPFRHIIMSVRSLKPKLVIVDSLYRIIPQGTNENDNNAMCGIMNRLDEYAKALGGSAFAFVHHFSKGNQAWKDVTDLGRGAGAMAGAVDTHCGLRQHEIDEHYVFEAVARTWPAPKPIVLRREFPLWVATEEDPKKLKGAKRQKGSSDLSPLDDAAFVTYLTAEPQSKHQLEQAMHTRDSIGRNEARALLDGIVGRHELHTLRTADGPRDCGPFTVEVTGRGGGLRFRLKPVES